MDHDDEVEEEEEVECVTAESYGALDTSMVSDECWMIRIPQKLAQVFEQAPEGTELGELIFTKGDGKTVKPSLTVHIRDDLTKEITAATTAATAAAAATATSTNQQLPLNYSMQAMTKKIPVMHPFTRNPNNGMCQILGTVSRTANLQVEKQDSTYRAMLKDRLVATNLNSNRYVKPAEITESFVSKKQDFIRNKKSFGNAVYQYGKRLLEAQQNNNSNMNNNSNDINSPANKKARQFAPDQSIRSILFELFGQQQYWTIKDLKLAAINGGCTMSSKKLEAEIREILRDIGEYHRSGDYKTKWELRTEFQQTKSMSSNTSTSAIPPNNSKDK